MEIASRTNSNLAVLKGRHRGGSGVIVGTGPSLGKYKKIDGAIHFGVNDAVWHDVKLDYLFVQDIKPHSSTGYKKCWEKYDGYPCVRLAGRSPTIKTAENIPDSHMASGWIPYEVGNEGKCEWVVECDKYALGDGQSVSFSAAQVALYTGVKRLYIVGMDILDPKTAYDIGDRDGNAYTALNHFEHWKSFASWVENEYPFVEVFNVNPVKLKGLFETYEN